MTSQRSIRTLSSRDTAPAGERVILSVVRCPRRLYKEALGPEFISDDSIPEQGLSSQMRLCSNKVLSSLGFGGLIFPGEPFFSIREANIGMVPGVAKLWTTFIHGKAEFPRLYCMSWRLIPI